MKITKKRLDRLIKKAIIKEYMSHASEYSRDYSWESCKLDLPDGFFTKKGSGSIKKAEAAASLAAGLYGIPGEFCNLISAAVGDNPEEDTKSAINRGLKNKKVLESGYFAALNKTLVDRPRAFVSNIFNQREKEEADKIQAIQDDRDIFDETLSAIDRLAGLRPQHAGSEILSIIANATGVSGSRSEINKAISAKKSQQLTDEDITHDMIFQAKLLCGNIARANLASKSLKDYYSSSTSTPGLKRAYDDFRSFVN